MLRPPRGRTRLVAVDSLRGIAALAVVLFHFTTRISELYPAASMPTFSFRYGYLGVNLFFIISGFVIFMTLEKTERPMDFVVSRFSRLYPAYWVAIALTFAVVTVGGLPGKEVSPLQAVGNLLMVHGFLRIPHVDGVYWTLEVEMLFYAGMLTMFATGRLHRIHLALCALVTLRMTYHVLAETFGVELSWTLSRILILQYIPWFALGICTYEVLHTSVREAHRAELTAAYAVTSICIVDGIAMGGLAVVLAALVWAAAAGRVAALQHPILVFFGAVSYPLYLLHENIGWVVERTLLLRGWPFDLTVLTAFGIVVLLAWLVSRLVERPAMKGIRAWYARSKGRTTP